MRDLPPALLSWIQILTPKKCLPDPPTCARLNFLPQRATNLNAIPPIEPEDPAARTARHLRMLAELAELGRQLARATAAKALADLAEPDPPEEPAEELQAEELPPEPAQAAIPRRTAARSSGTAPRKTDPVTSFLRLAKAVCEVIALEAGLAAGPATKSGLVPPALRADPRRETLLKAFREVTEHTQDRGGLRAEFTSRLDQELTADPEKILSLPEIFYPLCKALGIELDARKLSDEIIGMDPWDYENDPYCMDPPTPRATPPP